MSSSAAHYDRRRGGRSSSATRGSSRSNSNNRLSVTTDVDYNENNGHHTNDHKVLGGAVVTPEAQSSRRSSPSVPSPSPSRDDRGAESGGNRHRGSHHRNHDYGQNDNPNYEDDDHHYYERRGDHGEPRRDAAEFPKDKADGEEEGGKSHIRGEGGQQQHQAREYSLDDAEYQDHQDDGNVIPAESYMITSTSSPADTITPTAADGDEALLDLVELEKLHQEAEKMKAAGNKHMASQEYTKAYNAYSAALQLTPVGPSSHVFLSNRAAALLSLKRYDHAAQDARRAVALAPTFGKAHARLGQALYFLKDYNGAVAAYDDALVFEPDNPVTQTYRTKAQAKLEKQRAKAEAAAAKRNGQEADLGGGSNGNRRRSSAESGTSNNSASPTAAVSIDDDNNNNSNDPVDAGLEDSHTSVGSNVDTNSVETGSATYMPAPSIASDPDNRHSNIVRGSTYLSRSAQTQTTANVLARAAAASASQQQQSQRRPPTHNSSPTATRLRRRTPSSSPTPRRDDGEDNSNYGSNHHSSNSNDTSVASDSRNSENKDDYNHRSDDARIKSRGTVTSTAITPDGYAGQISRTIQSMSSMTTDPFQGVVSGGCLSPVDPDFEEAVRIQQRANKYLSNKQYKMAIEEYTAALFLVPDDVHLSPALHLGRAHALNGSRRHDGARNDAMLAIKLNPSLAAAHSTLAKSLFYLKDYRGAVDAFYECTRLLPNGETLGMFDRAYLQKAEAALEEEEASLFQAGTITSGSRGIGSAGSVMSGSSGGGGGQHHNHHVVVPKLPPPRFVPREEAMKSTPNVPSMPKQWPQQSPRNPASSLRCGPEHSVVFLSESLGIKLNRGPDGIVRVLSVLGGGGAGSGVDAGSPSASSVLREGEISAGHVVREAAGVDLRRPITNIMWGDTVALIKMAPRPITLVVAEEWSAVPATVAAEQDRISNGNKNNIKNTNGVVIGRTGTQQQRPPSSMSTAETSTTSSDNPSPHQEMGSSSSSSRLRRHREKGGATAGLSRSPPVYSGGGVGGGGGVDRHLRPSNASGDEPTAAIAAATTGSDGDADVEPSSTTTMMIGEDIADANSGGPLGLENADANEMVQPLGGNMQEKEVLQTSQKEVCSTDESGPDASAVGISASPVHSDCVVSFESADAATFSATGTASLSKVSLLDLDEGEASGEDSQPSPASVVDKERRVEEFVVVNSDEGSSALPSAADEAQSKAATDEKSRVAGDADKGKAEVGSEKSDTPESNTGANDATDEATAGASALAEPVSLRDQEQCIVGGEIIFQRDSPPTYCGWDNLRWLSYSGERKVRSCQKVFKFVESDTKTLFFKTKRKEYQERALAVYEEPNLILLLRRPSDLKEIHELLGLPDIAQIDDADNATSSYWIVQSVADPSVCKLHLSPLTTVTAKAGEGADDRQKSCFSIETPVESLALSAVLVRKDAKKKVEQSFSDSGAYLETMALETHIAKALSSAHDRVGDLGKLYVDLSWKHQIVLGTLHSLVVSGNLSALEEAINFARARLDGPDGSSRRLPGRIVDSLDDNGYSAIYYACSRRMSTAVATLIDAGVDVNAQIESSGGSLVHICCRNLDEKSLSMVLSVSHCPKPDPNALDARGWTPMQVATVEGRRPDGDEDANSLDRCIAALEAWGGQLLVPNPLRADRHPIASLAAGWRVDALLVLLRYVRYRFPLEPWNTAIPSQRDMSLSALYHYPVHCAVLSLRTLFRTGNEKDVAAAESEVKNTLAALMSHGFEPNERLDRLKEHPVDDIPDQHFVGHSPLQVLAVIALELQSDSVPSKTPGFQAVFRGVIASTAECLVKHGARTSLDPPPSKRVRRKVPEEKGRRRDVSNMKLDSNKAAIDILGGVDRMGRAKKGWAEVPSVDAPDGADLREEPNVAVESESPGGCDEKSCAVCWRVFGALMHRKHRCRVTMRYICDDCSGKRLKSGLTEYRVTDGQFNLAHAEALKSEGAELTATDDEPEVVSDDPKPEVEKTPSRTNLFGRSNSSRSNPVTKDPSQASRPKSSRTLADIRQERLESEDQSQRNSLFSGMLEQASNFVFGDEAEGQQSEAKAQVGGLAATLGETRDALLERGQKLETLNEKSAQLVDASADFARMAKQLRQKTEKQASFW